MNKIRKSQLKIGPNANTATQTGLQHDLWHIYLAPPYILYTTFPGGQSGETLYEPDPNTSAASSSRTRLKVRRVYDTFTICVR